MAPSRADGSGVKPLDGGWGWVVVLGAHISIGFAYSMPKVLPIFFKEIQEDLGTTSSQISLISSIMLAAIYGAGNYPGTLIALATGSEFYTSFLVTGHGSLM